MGKTLKYVSEFSFPSDKGYSGSAGQQMVKGYARGGSCGYAKGGMKPMAKAEGGAVDDPRRPLMDRTVAEYIDAINRDSALADADARMARFREMLPGPMSNAERMALMRQVRPMISQGMRSPRAEMARERALMGEGYKKGGMAKGGMTAKQQGKVGKVMGEFKAGELHSGSKSGPVVKSRKQAIAIGMSEARKAKK